MKKSIAKINGQSDRISAEGFGSFFMARAIDIAPISKYAAKMVPKI
jgi:hypothetical protein